MLDSIFFLEKYLPFLQTPIGAAIFVPLYAIWVTVLLPGVWASMLAGALYCIELSGKRLDLRLKELRKVCE